MEQVRALLERYAQPCAEDCDHSQCPLLRELHAIVISDTLERARITVKPMVDRERAGESAGDLMDMRLRASVAAPQGDAAKDAAGERERTCYWCKHADHGQKVCPVPYLAVGEGGLSGSYPCGCTQSTVLSDAPPATQPSAKLAAEEVMRCVLGFNEFDDLAQLSPENGNCRFVTEEVAAIIERHFPVQPVERRITIEEAAKAVYKKYGTNLRAFWRDAFAAQGAPADNENGFEFDQRCYYCRNKCCHNAVAHTAAISEHG